MLIAFILMQASSATAAPPDIELNIHATTGSVRIESKGETKLEVRAGPDAGSRFETRVTPPANGATTLKNVTVDVHAEARIGDTPQNDGAGATVTPQ
jgi:hypothetical protein